MHSKRTCEFPRIYAVRPQSDPAAATGRARALGFRQVLLVSDGEYGPDQTVPVWRPEAQANAIELWMTLALHVFPISHPLVGEYPAAFAVRHSIADGPVDPRRPPTPRGRALLRWEASATAQVIDWWIDRLRTLVGDGVRGFVVRRPELMPRQIWRQLTESVADGPGKVAFLADTIGTRRDALPKLRDCGIDYCLSSLPYWDGRASWLVEEHDALSEVAPVVAAVDTIDGPRPAPPTDRIWRIRIAAALGDGLLVPADIEATAGAGLVEEALRQANRLAEGGPLLHESGRLRSLTGPGASVTALVQRAENDHSRFLIAVLNTSSAAVTLDPALAARASAEPGWIEPLLGPPFGVPLQPREARVFLCAPGQPAIVAVPKSPLGLQAAAASPRVIVDEVTPQIDGGAFAVKRIVGDRLVIAANIFADGHEQLAAEILFKAGDEGAWSRAPLQPMGNDRWEGEVLLSRVGRHAFRVEAWLDRWGGFVRDLAKKREAGQDLALDIQEGREVLRAALELAKDDLRLTAALARTAATEPAESVEALLAPALREAMAALGQRAFLTTSFVQTVEVERAAARFSSWYELFPRSQTDDPARPGTFRGVIDRLPAIRDMGFDVLYFPPIHPIGQTNRKGRNNSLTAASDDPGSPYAIGSADGGHDAIEPGLGTLDDFKALLAAARSQGIEIALDFAVQCSPDHPWLKQHPGWFAWRPDGSIKHAENPPKKYEDIVNVDFYAPAAIPGLWLALRDIVLHWIAQGVKIFRVDNPHTKPLPFWQWMIEDIRGAHPDVIFLAEAFTRPKLMYHLAKAGFSQSYTYFTWRHTKTELIEYLTELTTTAVREFFRPHFFVNTPDINPYFLQRSGRGGFLIRAALAATLSGLWGVYSGFELCEAEPLPGREEYKDSEKYEIRPRDWNRPGNIIAEISQLNRLRKAEPALQSHLGLTFYNAVNDQVLYFAKTAPGQTDKILVAISLDPHGVQEANFEVPLWDWGLPDHAAVESIDLLHDSRTIWRGKVQHVTLSPDAPYAIWRIQPVTDS